MPDEITINKQAKDESSALQNNQSVNMGRKELVNLCALGLGISFFLPWAQIFFTTVSGFDLQKSGDGQLLLWAIPLFCIITIIAGYAKQSQKNIGQFTGLLPFIVGGYWYFKLNGDLFQILTYGAYLSLGFGAALIILPRNQK